MKFLPLLGTSLSGSVGGLTAAHNRGGAYFRSKTIPVNPQSASQVVLRASASQAAQSWAANLTEAQRLAWDLYAGNVAWTDKIGQSTSLSGVNMYSRTATYLAYLNNWLAEGLTPIADAPVVFALGTTPIIESAEIVRSAGPPETATLNLTIANTGDYAAGDTIGVHVGGEQGAGINFFKGPFILSGSADPSTGTAAVELTTPPYSDRYPVPSEGNKVWGYARVLHSDGRLSSRSNFGPVVAPAPV